jgi:hypothetical protein
MSDRVCSVMGIMMMWRISVRKVYRAGHRTIHIFRSNSGYCPNFSLINEWEILHFLIVFELLVFYWGTFDARLDVPLYNLCIYMFHWSIGRLDDVRYCADLSKV